MSSIIKTKLGSHYELLNKTYPSIEGNLLVHLDAIFVAEILDKETHPSIYSDGFEMNLNHQLSIVIRFKFSQKRIALYIRGLSNYQRRITITKDNRLSMFEIKKAINKKLNLNSFSGQRHISGTDYNFRYNYRNCQRIVDIIKFLSYDYLVKIEN